MSSHGRARIAWVALQGAICLLPASMSARELPRPKQSEVRVECGNVLADTPSHLRLRSGCVRLLVGREPRSSMGIAFRYLGPSPDTVPLASGELRRQIGIKLRAKDTCNLVYVMWQLAPTQGLWVSIKTNPGKHEHIQCRDGGYVQVSQRGLPAVGVGERHTLRAQIAGSVLRVDVDGVLAWQGQLPEAALEVDGPAGLRSDNGSFDVEIEETEAASSTRRGQRTRWALRRQRMTRAEPSASAPEVERRTRLSGMAR